MSGTNLHIEHFALHSPFIGNNNGERCLRAFAKMLSNQCDTITSINFSLHRTTSSVKGDIKKLEKVRDARLNLLNKIGSDNVNVEHPNKHCYDVKGVWNKSKW